MLIESTLDSKLVSQKSPENLTAQLIQEFDSEYRLSQPEVYQITIETKAYPAGKRGALTFFNIGADWEEKFVVSVSMLDNVPEVEGTYIDVSSQSYQREVGRQNWIKAKRSHNENKERELESKIHRIIRN